MFKWIPVYVCLKNKVCDQPVSVEKIQDYYSYLVGCIFVLWVQFHSSLIMHIMHPKLKCQHKIYIRKIKNLDVQQINTANKFDTNAHIKYTIQTQIRSKRDQIHYIICIHHMSAIHIYECCECRLAPRPFVDFVLLGTISHSQLTSLNLTDNFRQFDIFL